MKLKIVTFIVLIILSLINAINRFNDLFSITVSSLIPIILLGYLIYKSEFNKKRNKVIISVILSIIFCIFTCERFIESFKYEKIEIKNTSSSIILLDSIYIDGEKVKIDKKYNKEYDLIHNASFKTEYKIQNKNTDKYKGTLKPNEKYILNINKKEKVEIQLQRKKTDFHISINQKNIAVKGFNYDSLTVNALQMGNYNYKYNFDNTFINYKNITNWLIIILLFILNFCLINLCISNKKLRLLFIFVNVLEFNPIGNVPFVMKLILIVFLLFILKNIETDFTFDKNKKNKMLFLVSSLYISFSILGKYIMDGFNISNLLYYIIMTFFVYLLIPFLISFIEIISSKVNKYDNKIENQLFFHRLLVFCITFIILYLYKFIFYPYIYLADSFMQFSDITNNTLSNWHPYLHTVLLKLFYSIFGNLNPFIYFRIIIYSLLLNQILFYFHNKGMKLLHVYFVSIAFTIVPTTGIIMVTLLKDVDFIIAFVALTFYTYLLYNDFFAFHKNKLNYFFLLLSLIAVAFFRHNGIFVSAIIALLLLILSIRKKKTLLSMIVFIFIIAAFIIKDPLYKQLKVEDAPKNFNIATIIHGLDYVMIEDKNEYDTRTYNYLTKNILSYNDFKLYYDRYNIDILLHYNSDNEGKKIRNLEVDQKKVIQIYLNQILKSPIYLLKDRLYGTDIIWDVIEDDKINVLKYQVLYDEFDINYKLKNIINSNNSKVITNILNWISSNNLFNILFFRVGFYIDILIIFINYQMIKKKKNSLTSLIPLFINLVTLFIAMHYQAFRYVWMVPSVTILFIFITIFNCEKN